MSIEIRRASIEDIPWLCVELEKFAEFFGTKIKLYNPETSTVGLTHLINHHYFSVAEKTGVGPIGFIAGMIGPHFFNPEIRQLTECFWWVQEEHRLSRAGILLFDAYLAYGLENADWVNFTFETHSPVKDEFLLKRGFRLQERSFLYEVN